VDAERLRDNLSFNNIRPITTRDDIDQEVENITNIVAAAIEKSVPTKIIRPWSKGFWTTECTQATQAARHASNDWLRLDTEESYQALRDAKREKRRVIRKTKRAAFYKAVREALDDEESIWRLAKWAKGKAN